MITINNSQLTINNKKKESTVNCQLSTVRQRGFTLIELIVVFAVIIILFGMILAVVDPFSQIQKAKDTQRKSDLSQIQKILEQFYQDNSGKYPTSSLTSHTCGSPSQPCPYRILDLSNPPVAIEWGVPFSPYTNVLPKDPAGNKRYVYYSPTSSNGQTYYLYASLDRGSKDPQICKNLNANGECSTVPAANLCGGKCNYGVSSANTSP